MHQAGEPGDGEHPLVELRTVLQVAPAVTLPATPLEPPHDPLEMSDLTAANPLHDARECRLLEGILDIHQLLVLLEREPGDRSALIRLQLHESVGVEEQERLADRRLRHLESGGE